MKYDIQFTNQFKKDLKLAKKQNKNLDKLFEVIDILANGGTLEAKYRDHDLTGNYKGTRECHVEPDWLLIYEICGDVLVLMLYRLGSHSELFKKYVQTGIYLLMLRTFAANLFHPCQSFFSFVLSWFFLRSSTIFANHSTLAGS